jgi:hypothetical protein
MEKSVLIAHNRARNDFYMGYKVDVGKFTGSSDQFVASSPNENYMTGAVYVYNSQTKNRAMPRFYGEQFGAYFGYDMVVDNFNNDKISDLIISAPYYSFDGIHENGIVYWLNLKKEYGKNNTGKTSFKIMQILNSTYEYSGQFGRSLAKLGDINLDQINGCFNSNCRYISRITTNSNHFRSRCVGTL